MKYKCTNVNGSWTSSSHQQVVLTFLAKHTCLTIKFSQGFHKLRCVRFELFSLINNVSMNTCMGNTIVDHTAACITVFINEIFLAVIKCCEIFFSINLWMYYPCSISLSLCIAVPNMVTSGGEECYKSGITVCKSVGTEWAYGWTFARRLSQETSDIMNIICLASRTYAPLGVKRIGWEVSLTTKYQWPVKHSVTR